MAAVKVNEISGFRRGVVEVFVYLGMLSPKRRYPTTSQRRATPKKREDTSGKHV